MKAKDVYILYELVLRDMKIKYKRSVIGILWTVLNPLMMMGILWIVFSSLFRFEIENYAVYVLCGQIIFQYFQTSTSEAMTSISANGGLMRKIFVPQYVFVVTKILSGSINLLASVLALIVVMLVTKTPVSGSLILGIVPLLLLMVFSAGVGFFLAAVAVKFHDMVHLYSVLCTGVFYVTPIIYPLSILPATLEKVVLWNPMTVIIEQFRETVIHGRGLSGASILYAGGVSAGVLAVGLLVFKLRENHFIMDI